MKRNGEKIKAQATDVITLKRPEGAEPVEFVITALPLGSDDDAERLFPSPTPPYVYAKDKKGKVLISQQGQPVREPELANPTFRKERRECASRQMVYYVVLGLSEDDTEFETELNWEPNRAAATADALILEFREAGISTGDLVDLLSAINKLSNLTREEVEQAAEGFSEETAGG